MVKPYFETKNGKLYCGDNLKIMSEIPPVDLVITDPPYNVGIDYGETHNDKLNDFISWMKPRFELMREKSKTVLFTTGQIRLPDYAQIEPWKWLLCWHKPAAMGRSPVGFCNFEPIAMWGKGCNNSVDVIRAMITPDKTIDWHPCPKPLEWAMKLLAIFRHYETVLDPFAGSGTVPLACERWGKKWVGIEINPEYCKQIKRRILRETRQLTIT